jgi:hypothetical protein
MASSLCDERHREIEGLKRVSSRLDIFTEHIAHRQGNTVSITEYIAIIISRAFSMTSSAAAATLNKVTNENWALFTH